MRGIIGLFRQEQTDPCTGLFELFPCQSTIPCRSVVVIAEFLKVQGSGSSVSQISPTTEGPLPSCLQSFSPSTDSLWSLVESLQHVPAKKSQNHVQEDYERESLSFNGLIVLDLGYVLCTYAIYILCLLQNLGHAKGFCLQDFVGPLPYIGRK